MPGHRRRNRRWLFVFALRFPVTAPAAGLRRWVGTGTTPRDPFFTKVVWHASGPRRRSPRPAERRQRWPICGPCWKAGSRPSYGVVRRPRRYLTWSCTYGMYTMVVYQIDEDLGVAHIGDMAATSMTIRLDDLARVRGKVCSHKNRVLSFRPPKKLTAKVLKQAVLERNARMCRGFSASETENV